MDDSNNKRIKNTSQSESGASTIKYLADYANLHKENKLRIKK